MALKPDRYIVADESSFFMDYAANLTVKGVVASVSTFSSGAGLDDAAALATIKTDSSGAQPIGILLTDVVNYDLTKQHLNVHKDEVQSGQKVRILTNGWAVTDKLHPNASTIAVGDTAYLGPSGLIKNTVSDGVTNYHPVIGRFLSKKNQDGFAKVAVNLP